MTENQNRYPPDQPKEWLNRARSNLIRAQNNQPKIYLEDLCFDAQQAAEKAMKALLIKLEVDFPYTHDLADLLTLVEQAGQQVPEDLKSVVILTDYAVESRYPGLAEPVTEEEYNEALSLAEDFLDWVEETLETN